MVVFFLCSWPSLASFPFLVIFLFLRNGDLLWVTERLRMFACLLAPACLCSLVWPGLESPRLLLPRIPPVPPC
uniref:Uncharacterized protein n=1 Tax=Ixodes scapularis TaxID=6945 RepID=A0A4D5RX66_IXOSC